MKLKGEFQRRSPDKVKESCVLSCSCERTCAGRSACKSAFMASYKSLSGVEVCWKPAFSSFFLSWKLAFWDGEKGDVSCLLSENVWFTPEKKRKRKRKNLKMHYVFWCLGADLFRSFKLRKYLWLTYFNMKISFLQSFNLSIQQLWKHDSKFPEIIWNYGY